MTASPTAGTSSHRIRSARTGLPSWVEMSRSAGCWLAGLASAYSLVNVARAVSDPAGFADYLGLPLAAAVDERLVLVYASRTMVIALFAAALLARREVAALTVLSGLLVPLPIADAWLVSQADAGQIVIGRHLAIAAFLGVTTVLLARLHLQVRETF